MFSVIESTKEPIFSYDLLKGWEQKDEKKEFMNLINSLPDCNKTLFHMITGFFTEVLKKWKADGIQADVPTIIS
ncbi:phosphatidylinositol dephosphorylation [Trichomonas vaginalis G3]|uniref:phosphatidylinositol dephosphorylation n=1 Tax=Trichomonas vaginalis (strain ATCC PRA-98 / G3) TaxID=412133 RepID=UPI0021E59955|nr:phosphatidylinositol dephosphorylation [Trichomonas vaginalis G3]KAI5524517.1 phosphatidylinositol dephosphorylation [Trichomonas vaginalis G3]